MDAEFQKQGLTDLTETDLQAVVTPGETLRLLPTLARLLHVLRENQRPSPSQQLHTKKILPQL